MNILIDTNLWVSALISASMRMRIHKIIADETITILANESIIEELEEVCSRPKFIKILPPDLVSDFIQILQNRLTFIETNSNVQVCRDPDDDFLLAICQDGDADYFITGDNDLLVLQQYGKTQIITLSDYEEKFNAR